MATAGVIVQVAWSILAASQGFMPPDDVLGQLPVEARLPVRASEKQALPATPLTMENAVQWALAKNRALVAERLSAQQSDIARMAASLWPNPDVSFGVGNVVVGAGNDQERNLHPAPFSQTINTIVLQQVLDLFGKHQSRIRAAKAKQDVASLQIQEALRRIVFQVRSAFAVVVREQAEYALAEQTRARHEQSVMLSRRRHKAGDIAKSELSKVELELLKYVNFVYDAEAELALAKRALAELMALEPGLMLPTCLALDHVVTHDDQPLRSTSSVPSFADAFAHAMMARPDVLALKASQTYWATSRDAASRHSLPDVALQLGYQRSYFQISGDNPHSLNVGLQVPLPIFDRNRAERAEVALQERLTDNSVQQLRDSVAREVGDALSRLTRAVSRMRTFDEDGMLSRAEEALVTAEHSFAAGAISLLELLEAQRTSLETRADYLSSRYDTQQAHLDLAFVTATEFL